MEDLNHEKLTRLNKDLDNGKKKKGVVREYIEALLVAVLLAFFIRSFIVEPYKIPSKSMVPTLLVGDHIFVNKFIYGLRIPGTKKWIAEFSNPKRGEVIVFIYPDDESLDFIKRVIGLPGDKVKFQNGRLTVNDQEVPETDIDVIGVDPDDKRKLLLSEASERSTPDDFQKVPYYRGYGNYQIKVGDMMGYQHYMQRSRLLPNDDSFELVVPADHYFVLGDNRDQSADSRVWGFVPRDNLKGRAMFIWLSLDSDQGGIRFKRFGRKII